MKSQTTGRFSAAAIATLLPTLLLSVMLLSAAAEVSAQAVGPTTNRADPRVDLGAARWIDAEQAIRNLELVAHVPRPPRFFNPAQRGDFGFANTDLAFSGNLVFMGSYNGFQVYDISDPSKPSLRSAFVCPGGQGDMSVYGNLLFMSAEETRGRVDCGTSGVMDTVSAERFRGVRIFDISNIESPRQVAAVQTCRGSHTHTLVPDPKDRTAVYLYVSGTNRVRPPAELAGCSQRPPTEDPNTSYFRIEVIRVPLADPQEARIVSTPRIFADTTGAIAGLWKGGDHGPGTQTTSETEECHDITVYPELGLAAGACSGNGILLDIRDPANPKRIDEVIDPNFAYWHSATLSSDGRKVIFTDEWGGGGAPKCRATDRPEWGANAIFTRDQGKLRLAGYYKLPAPQTAMENCVAHNGSLIPVPGRDIMVQAWYQGGISVFDFTNPARPVEIAFFDRGPVDSDTMLVGGHWSAYWYNGHIYGSEILRGLDVLQLTASEHLSQNEIDAAKLVRVDRFNPQHQTKPSWPASFVVARAYLDQLARNTGIARDRAAVVGSALDRAERLSGGQRRTALRLLASQLARDVRSASDAARVRALAAVVRDLARAPR